MTSAAGRDSLHFARNYSRIRTRKGDRKPYFLLEAAPVSGRINAMPEMRRKFEHLGLYMITNRLAEGLPLVANEFVNSIIYGVLARAQEAVPDIDICAFHFMANHYHGYVIPRGDPNDVSKFLQMLDGELAKIVNRLLGKRNCIVWAQRAHPAQILDFDAAVNKIAYAFLNPSAAHLVDSIDEWRGVSSWEQMFAQVPIQTFAVLPTNIHKLPNRPFRNSDIRRYLQDLSDQEVRALPLVFKPFAFKECFAASRNLSDEEVRNRIVRVVRQGEAQYRQERKELKRAPLGVKALAEQNPYKPFKPKKFGRRVFCISTCEELRQQFIEAYKEFCRKCEQAWQLLKQGLPAQYPPGAFLPSLPPRANILPLPL